MRLITRVTVYIQFKYTINFIISKIGSRIGILKQHKRILGTSQRKQFRITKWTSDIDEVLVNEDQRGTFTDNMKTPIHRWFRYSAGFSHNLVEESIEKYLSSRKGIILDPFVGSGTTSVTAKKLGIRSVGIESHPFAAWVSRVKTFWDFDISFLSSHNIKLIEKVKNTLESPPYVDVSQIPELLPRCYSENNLNKLYAIKETILNIEDEHLRDFYMLALVGILRKVSKAHTGWPYLLPRKERTSTADVFESFVKQVALMTSDLAVVVTPENRKTDTKIHVADARQISTFEKESFDLAFTSPPYLNNFDYADRTRLELYFMTPFRFNGNIINVRTWKDMSREVRNKLIVSSSHQARELGLREGVKPIKGIESSVYQEIAGISESLEREKKLHSGHKDYDLLVVGYFNDMYQIINEVYNVLHSKARFILILGDSAPYGIHVPTDLFLARIAKGIGFSEFEIKVLRTRGEKWKSAPKHDVRLRESMVILTK